MNLHNTLATKREVSPVERIINEVAEKLKSEFNIFFSGKQTDIDAAESFFGSRIAEAVLQLLQAYYEQQDQRLLEDKAGRKQSGLSVERHGDKREVLTLFGRLEYSRTYYKKASGGYEYPIDELAGVEAYERISEGVALSLVNASCQMSYAKASRYVTDEHVSRQTVMNKIRAANPQQKTVERRAVPELHIDADEDHVNLQTGKSTIVPLVSVYEGIEHHGKRGVCKNVFHISEYGNSIASLWEQVSDEIERRYDLANAKIYLHGDGAAWIRQGLEYLPNCKFVLDRYHKNKAIKQALSGIDRMAASQYEHHIRKALDECDRDKLMAIRDTLLSRYPDREKTIRENMNYLLDNFEAIAITKQDAASLNGGCTEPHVSHVLSARLSSRPMGWSKETLTKFVPILAAGAATFDEQQADEQTYPSASVFLKDPRGRVQPNTFSLANPDHAVTFPARLYKITPLFNALRPF